MIKAWQSFVKESIKNNAATNNEFNKLTDNVIYSLDNYGVIAISGEDARKFLQGQLSCDVNYANTSSFTYGAYCNTKGRVIAFFKLLFWHDKYLLTLPLELIAPTMQELQKYVLISKVKIADYSNSIIQIGMANTAIMQDCIEFCNLRHNANKVFISQEIYSILEDTKQPNLTLCLLDINLAKTVWGYLSSKYSIADDNAYNLIAIQNKIPEIYLNTSGEFLPHNINLPQINAVSFKKGCYRGQEIIARMEYQAKLKKLLQHFTAVVNLPADDRIVNFCKDIVGKNLYAANHETQQRQSIGKVVRAAVANNSKNNATINILAEVSIDADLAFCSKNPRFDFPSLSFIS